MNPSLDAALATFPDALSVEAFLDRIEALLGPRDFLADRTLAMVSTCRDELTHPLTRAVTDRVGLAFNLGALGGVPSLGRTGWQAALSHVPDHGGRGHIVVLGMTHIGFGPDGTIGESLRRHQERPTATCGALMSILRDGDDDDLPGALDDNEKDRLKRLMRAVSTERSTDPLGITERAAAAIAKEMWAELDALEAWRTTDVAVFCGIQVHVHDHPDLVVTTDARLRTADGTAEVLTV